MASAEPGQKCGRDHGFATGGILPSERGRAENIPCRGRISAADFLWRRQRSIDQRAGMNGPDPLSAREAFVAVKDQGVRTITELQKRLDALTRERDELQRERDDLTRRLTTGPGREVAGQLAEAQKTVSTLRQARDSLVAQTRDLTDRLARTEEQLSRLDAEHETIVREHQAAIKQAQESKHECDVLRRKALDLSEEKFAFLEAGKNHETALTGLRQDLASAQKQRDEAIATAAALTKQQDDLRAQLEAAGTARPKNGNASQELEDARHKLLDLEAQMEGFKVQQKKNVATLTKHLASERDAMRAKFEADRASIEAQKAALEAQLADSSKNGGLAKQLEEQRLANSELAAQLDAARREITDLRETFIHARPPDLSEATVDEAEKAKATSVHTVAPDASAPLSEPLTGTDASVTLGAMCSCLEMLTDHPKSLELLEELNAHLEGFAERAKSSGFGAVYRLSLACAELTGWLSKVPAKISAATLQPLQEGLELLRVLAAMRHPEKVSDPTGALVYAVDDDPDNCECISMGLEKMHLKTNYATKPEVALTALAALTANPYDLIILDVDLPGMDGFELSRRIREIKGHAATPILFVSGLTSTQERLSTSPDAGSAFIAKPYNLNELGIKALGLILKTRLAGRTSESA